MLVPYVKYSGCGNTFILFDATFSTFSEPVSLFRQHGSTLCPQLCYDKHTDGVLVVSKSGNAYEMNIFNSDGSEAEMCGNGLRCIADYLYRQDATQSDVCIKALAGTYTCRQNNHRISTLFPPVHDLKFHQKFDAKDKFFTAHFANSGVPHIVHFVGDLHTGDFETYAPLLRNHVSLRPAGANVNFCKKLNDHTFEIRTFERGVEGETKACGTGAVAVATVAAYLYNITSPIDILTQSGEILTVNVTPTEIELIGSAARLEEGQIHLTKI